MANKSSNEEVYKANWSGFISLINDQLVNSKRIELLQNMQKFSAKCVKENANGDPLPNGDVSWRKTMGDSLIYLQNNASPQELLNLLTLEGYIDRPTYVKVSMSFGVGEVEANTLYKKLAMNQDA